MHIGYWWEVQTEGANQEDQDVGRRIILKIQDGLLWTGLIWLRIGISGGLL
jgi:hypothetical protein